jgi:mevalonate pyrophosphate decarboxylase
MSNTKWEYDFVVFSDKYWYEATAVVLERLNEMGNDGWEIVNISADTGTGIRYLMKREKPSVVVREASDAESSSTSRD